MKKDVKIIVDYVNGCYNAVTFHDGKILVVRKPIINYFTEKRMKHNYSNQLLNKRREKMLKDIEKIVGKDRNANDLKKIVNETDPMIYAVLCDLDKEIGTTYALEYLKNITQKFQRYDISKKAFKTVCKDFRREYLKNAGISISYNVALFNATRGLSIFDKIKGIILAKKQEKFMGAEVLTSVTLEKAYMDDIFYIESSIERINKDIIRELDDDSELIMREIKNDEENRLRIKENKLRVKERKKREVELEKNTQIVTETTQTVEGDASLSREERNSGIIEEQRSGTIAFDKGAKAKLSRKKKLAIQREQKKKYNGHYATQMRLKAEREKKREQAEERIARKKVSEKEEKNEGSFKPTQVKFKRSDFSLKNSIRNKRFIPNPYGIKRVITRAVTLLAAGAVALGIHIDSEISEERARYIDNTSETQMVTNGNNNDFYSGDNIFENHDEKVFNNLDDDKIEDIQDDKKSEDIKIEIKVEDEPEVEIDEGKNLVDETVKNSNEKSDEEKIEELKKFAFELYLKAFKIGEIPNVNGMLDNEHYSGHNDGSGSKGYFKNHKNSVVAFINFFDYDKKFITISAENFEGKNLFELINENKGNYSSYSVAMKDPKTGVILGFLNKNYLEKVIKEYVEENINEIAKDYKKIISKNITSDTQFDSINIAEDELGR